jgi:iron(III) transport system permease protein
MMLRPALLLGGLAAAIVATPILAVVSSLLWPSLDVLGHLAETILPRLLGNTAGMILLVGVGTVVIGTGTAWLVTMCRFPGARWFAWALLLPLAMPAYIIGYAYTDALTFAGPVQTALREAFGWARGDYWFPDIHTLGGVSAILTLVLYPYVYILARAAFLQNSVVMTDASRVLGHGAWATFLRVALPLARPAIVAGAALALMEALADFGTVQYFGVDTFTTAIYRTWFGFGDRLAAMQLATGLLAMVLLLVALERWSRAERRYAPAAKRRPTFTPYALTGPRAAAAIAACALPVFLGFVLPVIFLLRLHSIGGDPLLGERFLGLARNSLMLAAGAALLIMAVATGLALALRHERSRAFAAFVRFGTIGYAIPGTVVAVGVLVPLGFADAAIDGTSRAFLGVGTGLVFSGTVVALLFAYVVRFLAVGYGAVDAGMTKVDRRLDEVARTLGRAPANITRSVHLPLLKRSVLAGGIVVFVDVLKELPATLIVRPFDFDTLAVRVYQLASDERLAQASTGALGLVVIGILPVILLTRMMAAEAQGEGAAGRARGTDVVVRPGG